MTSTAILIGNANYLGQDSLPCCLEDVAAMKALIEATGRFEDVRGLVDLTGDAMREAIRHALPDDTPQNEVFLYFSGHGTQIAGDFYYCGTKFDSDRPNETGMSHTQLHDLLRAAEPKLLVKVIDACFSGTLLVKAERQPPPIPKEGFRHVLQFSSSLDDQTSFAGETLSAFTRAFLEASVRKTEGTVYYSDVFNALRDKFLDNEDQTPFFVSQGTGRDILVDDVAKLGSFRETFKARWTIGGDQDVEDDEEAEETSADAAPLTTTELLTTADKLMADPLKAKALINELFDGVLARFKSGEFAEFFDCSIIEHSDYEEPTVRDFMVRVLARESRPDQLVTAGISRKKIRRNPWQATISAAALMFDEDWAETFDLELNCTLERAQLRLTLTPLYRTLKQMVLVLSVAPSLERCYLFEVLTQHPLTDWATFSTEGEEVVRRWYKLDWDEKLDQLIEKICVALENAVRTHIEETAERLKK